MAKKRNDIEETIIGVGLILGALWLGEKIIESLSVKCLNCGRLNKKNISNCSNCGRFLGW